ncbi:MAG: hypothetical protein ACRDT6_25260 [Micromonosporaceae bacterium]
MLIAVASVKGSPGATSLALGLAALWPARDAVLVEADPEGGDLAARFGHCPQPGLASLAASARAGVATQPLRWHTQHLAVGADAVLAPPGDGAAASVQTLAYSARQLSADPGAGTVVCDLGRLTHGGPAAPIAAAADHLLLVVRPTLEDLAQFDARLAWLRSGAATTGRLWVVLAGRGGYTATDVALAWGVKVAGELPRDGWGAGVLCGRLWSRGWRRLRLSRAICGIAASLTAAGAAKAPGLLSTPSVAASAAAGSATAGVVKTP